MEGRDGGGVLSNTHTHPHGGCKKVLRIKYCQHLVGCVFVCRTAKWNRVNVGCLYTHVVYVTKRSSLGVVDGAGKWAPDDSGAPGSKCCT